MEKYILSNLRRFDVSQIKESNWGVDERPSKKLELAGLEEHEKTLADKLSNSKIKNMDFVINQLENIQDQKEALRKEIQDLDIKYNSRKDDPLQQTKSLIQLLEENPSTEIKDKLRSIISSVISKIVLYPFKDSKGKCHTKIVGFLFGPLCL